MAGLDSETRDMVLDPLRVGGTEEQKTQWLSKIADEALLMAQRNHRLAPTWLP